VVDVKQCGFYKEPRDLKNRISGKYADIQTAEEDAADWRLAEAYGFEYGKVPDIQLGHTHFSNTPFMYMIPTPHR
jgi:hypothetical protein